MNDADYNSQHQNPIVAVHAAFKFVQQRRCSLPHLLNMSRSVVRLSSSATWVAVSLLPVGHGVISLRGRLRAPWDPRHNVMSSRHMPLSMSSSVGGATATLRSFFVKRAGDPTFVKITAPIADVADLLDAIAIKLPSLRTQDLSTVTLHKLLPSDELGAPLDSTRAIEAAGLAPLDRLVVVSTQQPSSGRGLVPPPVLSRPQDGEISGAVQEIAELVLRDMEASANLEEQRKRTGLGDLLLKPWPTSRLDAGAEQPPSLAAELLPYVGDYRDYEDALRSTNTNQAQQRHIVAVVQASGSGKTRLAYADGLSTRLVVLARVWKQKASFTPSWATFMLLASHWASSMPLIATTDRRRVSQAAMAAMRLLAACHVAFVADVLSQIASAPTKKGSHHQSQSINIVSAAVVREAALRCLRNGKGDDTVAAMFLQHLSRVTSVETVKSAFGSALPMSVPLAVLDRTAVDQVCADADAALRRHLWPGAEVLLWWDEAQALLSSQQVFIPNSIFVAQRAAEVNQLQDCFYGLTALCSDLADKYKWLQTLCGTWMDLITRVDVSDISPLRGRVTSVYHASYIKVDDMLRTLRHFLRVDAATEADLKPLLEQLRGRPIFFFSDFLPAMWSQMMVKSPHSSALVDPAGLRQLLLQSAKSAVGASRERMGHIVTSMWKTDPVVLASGLSSRTLCMELYAALKMNGGRVQLRSSAGAEALRRGLLVVPIPAAQSPSLEATSISLLDEPITYTILQKHGDEKVRESARDADKDPILQLLSETIAHGSVAGFGLTSSVKGDVLELSFVWHVMRSVLLHSNDNSRHIGIPLATVFSPLTAPSFALPSRAYTEFVAAARGVDCGTISLAAGETDFHQLREPGAEQIVLYGVDVNAGVDVAFQTLVDPAQVASIVMVQAKARKRAHLADSLRAASPAWQYTQRPDRITVLAGAKFQPTAARQSFQNLADSPAMSQRFRSAFRVALSATGFRSDVTTMCNNLNAGQSASSPIILLQPSKAAFGSRFMKLLEDSCAGGSPTFGTAELAYLLPQSVGDVALGKVLR